MKKLIDLTFLLILFSGTVAGQITGDGSFGAPFTGTITSPADNFTITGTKYFDMIDVSGGTLTISPGATLYAVNTTSYITISSTGVLYAVGSISNIITLTADNNGDGVVDPGETWGSLSFDLSTGISVVDYAIIEQGTGNVNYGLGGGILIYGNNVTISHSTVRNCNITGDGGGIYLLPTGTNVILNNLILHDNSATGNGGALVIDGTDASTVTGGEIYNNTAGVGDGIYLLYPATITDAFIHNHSTGTGVYIPDVVSGASIRNCVIYNNNIGIYFSGDGNVVNSDILNNSTGIISGTTIAPKIVNTVLWGNTTAQYTLVSGAAMELAYCGIQGGLSGGTDGGGNKALSATNGADTGPNFVTPASNFHINAAISPLVDGGISSYTGVTIPGTDIEGKSRIGTLDIGAYEFIYYLWTGITSNAWTTTSNWLGSPASVPTTITDGKVVIPAGCPNYPTTASLTLSTRSTLTIDPGAALTVTGATSVGAGCTFHLRSDATGSANFITGSSVSGLFIIDQFLLGGGGPDYRWHYVTTPINNYDKSVLTTGINNPYDLLDYRENRVTTDKQTGWNWHDGYNSTPGFLTLLTTRGYDVYIATDQTASFTGTILPGTSFTNSAITCGTGDATQRGWNLIGNPFTSGVDANQFILTDRLVDKAIYFTKDNHFLSWNTFTHVGAGVGVSNVVPALQGFFVHSSSATGSKSVTIPAASRLYTGNLLYKKSFGITKGALEVFSFPYVKVNVSDGAAFSDDAVIYFFNDATTAFDTDYDAYKLFSENQADPQINSVSESMDLCINGLPVPDKITVVPLKLRIGIAKSYTINLVDIQNLDNCRVTLIHGTERTDLKANPVYTFPASAGTLTDMSLEFDMTLTKYENIHSDFPTSCWYSNNSLYIKVGTTGFESNSSLIINDASGRVVFSKNDMNLGKRDIVEIPLNLPKGFYITTVLNKYMKISKKIVISQ